MALAGGVGIQVPQKQGYLYEEGGIGSPDGHCRAFDARAQGTVSGSGVGIVLLKRLGDALADGDSIRAVIRGSAINNDGSSKIGYTAPSIDGQAEVIAEAQAVAGIEPETITYVETHGTGTVLGDPIEIAALTRAFRSRTQNKGFCAIGSVKTNFGHLDEAAGVAGLIKTVLALEHKKIPPSLHFEQPNPRIDFVNSPFVVNTRCLTGGQTARRAGPGSAHLESEEPMPMWSSKRLRRSSPREHRDRFNCWFCPPKPAPHSRPRRESGRAIETDAGSQPGRCCVHAQSGPQGVQLSATCLVRISARPYGHWSRTTRSESSPTCWSPRNTRSRSCSRARERST